MPGVCGCHVVTEERSALWSADQSPSLRGDDDPDERCSSSERAGFCGCAGEAVAASVAGPKFREDPSQMGHGRTKKKTE